MICTNELRFIERMVEHNEGGKFIAGHVPMFRPVRILQQKWLNPSWPHMTDFEWRDVPLVKEEA